MLDKLIQLHESLEVHYYVSHYVAYLVTMDGGRRVLKGEGESVDSAINALKDKCTELGLENVKQVRKLPTLREF